MKSLTAFLVALGVASGKPLWGAYHARRRRVLVLDYEGGDAKLRLRRLAASMGLDFESLVNGDVLHLSVVPDRFLDDADAEAWLTEACAGFGLVVTDSLRQAAPSADENRSEIGVTLAVPTRVSLATGCAFIVVTHSGKTQKEGSKDERQTATRGSSAIFSQAGCVWHFARDPTRPGVHAATQCKRPTAAWGSAPRPITMRVHDDDDDEHAVSVLDIEEDDDGAEREVEVRLPGLVIDLIDIQTQTGPAGVIADALEDQILAELKKRSPQSRNHLASVLCRRKDDVGKALANLQRATRVAKTRDGYVPATSPQPELWDGFEEEL